MLHRVYNIVTFYNLAACYQRRGLFKDSQSYLTRAIDHLKIVIEEQSITDDYQCLLYERFYCQFVLQSCAIKSQLQEHEPALGSACQGLTACFKVFTRAARLCQDHFEDGDSRPQTGSRERTQLLNQRKKKKSVKTNKMGRESATKEYGEKGYQTLGNDDRHPRRPKARQGGAGVKSHSQETRSLGGGQGSAK